MPGESHTDTGIRRIVKPVLERTLPVYTVDKPVNVPVDRVVAAATTPPAGPSNLEALLCHLLRTAPVPTLPPQPKPTELEISLKQLLSGVPTPPPTPPPQTGMAEVEALLQRLLPGTSVMTLRERPGPARRDWNTIVCFSCGKSGHGASWCHEMNETFPYVLPGWSEEKVGGGYVMISPVSQWNASAWETAPDLGRGVSRPDQ